MRNTFINLSSSDYIVSLTGVVTAILPMILVTVFIVYFIHNMESKLIYKIFKFPKDLREYKKIKNILKVLGFTIIQLFILVVILYMMILYYLIYYGIFLPRLYGVEMHL